MTSTPYAIGLLIGVIVGVIIAALLVRYMNRDKKLKTQYDEMQQKARGKAFCYAFYTVIILEALLIFTSLFELRLPMTDAVLHFTIIVIGILVLAAYCIWHDAYIGLNTNMKRYAIVLIIAGAINLFSGITAIANGRMVADGQLQTPFINLLCAIMLIIVGILMFIKKEVDSGEEEGEES